MTSATLHTGTAGTAATITETGGAAGYSTTTSCVDANSALTGNVTAITGATASITIPAANMDTGGTTLLTETVPANTVFSNAAPSTGWSCANGAPAGTVCTLALNSFPGAPGNADFRVVVNSALPAGTLNIANSVTTSVGTCSGCTVSNPVGPVLDTVKVLNGINGVAAGAGAAVKAGDILDYHITITNTGGTGGTTLLTETVPANTVFSNAAPSTGWSCANGAPAGTVCTQALNSFPGAPGNADFRVVVNNPVPVGPVNIVNTLTTSVGTCSGCTVTTPLLPTVRVAKKSVGAVGTFVFDTNNVTNQGDTITTVASGTTVTSPTLHVGTVGLGMTVNEFGGIAGYSLASTCVDANSATTGNTTPITATGQLISIPNASMKPGAQYLCAFTNTRVFANLSVVQTANPATVQAGADLSLTLTVNNAGPAAANEAILRDQPGAGLSCGGVPGCTASAGAACPAAGLLTAAALASSAGVAIPVLPMGGQVVVTLACTATADGK